MSIEIRQISKATNRDLQQDSQKRTLFNLIWHKFALKVSLTPRKKNALVKLS